MRYLLLTIALCVFALPAMACKEHEDAAKQAAGEQPAAGESDGLACGGDCGQAESGYNWAKDNATTEADCNSLTAGYHEGCLARVREGKAPAATVPPGNE